MPGKGVWRIKSDRPRGTGYEELNTIAGYGESNTTIAYGELDRQRGMEN
jgi:hypothetical protein